MKDNALISIVGKQMVDGAEDIIDLNTIGSYYKRDGKRFIKYTEIIEEDNSSLDTNIEIDEETQMIILRRDSMEDHSLILEKQKRHMCCYFTPVGNITIGVFTRQLDMDLDNTGGVIKLKYDVEFDSECSSENELKIEVKVKK